MNKINLFLLFFLVLVSCKKNENMRKESPEFIKERNLILQKLKNQEGDVQSLLIWQSQLLIRLEAFNKKWIIPKKVNLKFNYEEIKRDYFYSRKQEKDRIYHLRAWANEVYDLLSKQKEKKQESNLSLSNIEILIILFLFIFLLMFLFHFIKKKKV